VEPVEPALPAPDAEPEPAHAVTEPADAVTEPADAVTISDDVGTDALASDIDEDAPLAAAVVVETGPSAQVVDEGGPFAALVAANRRLLARWNAPVEPDDEPVADAVVAAAVHEDPQVATASDVAPATEPEAVDEDAPIAAAVATPDPAAVDSAAATADSVEATPEAAPRPMLVPSAIGRQILTGTPAEPAA
jgi:hypothetical protein